MMDKQKILLSRLSLIAACFAFLVIGLGAYTRLIDAGLGCPDWPGCYGHFSVPNSKQEIQQANLKYPAYPVVMHKAWAEMVHRYFAGILGFLILLIFIISVWVALRQGLEYLIIGIFLFALLIYQAILGMWTVTLKLLPLVVSQHLLGGMAIFALLWLMYLISRQRQKDSNEVSNIKKFKPWVFLGLILILIEISLGAWTSANYAALSCPNFPYCKANIIWHYNIYDAFNLLSPIGIDYQGGVLNSAARMTIHMFHRFGAFIVFVYLLSLVFLILLKIKENHRIRKLSLFLIFVLMIQLSLGISNVMLNLPLSVAVAHNLCAALLLITMITLNYQVFARKEKQ